jgi:hypothetical protein
LGWTTPATLDKGAFRHYIENILRGFGAIMFLKRFLWFLSFSVFFAGLIYYFADDARAPQRQAVRASLTGELFIRSHKPDERLISGLVARRTTFWYFTAADRTVTGDILNGTSLAFRTDPAETGPFLQAGLSPLAGLGPDLTARADLGEAGGPDEGGIPEKIGRK